MGELITHMSNSEDCGRFSQYVRLDWKPDVFNWIECSSHTDRIKTLLADPFYSTRYAKAAHLAVPYQPPEVYWWTVDGKRFRKKRVQNLNYMRLLHKVLPDFDLGEVKQFVEFGGGTGDIAATLRSLGYGGTHFVLDLAPMNHLHWYWLRYAGFPAYIGNGVAPMPEAVRKKTILESSAADTLFYKHVDTKAWAETVFFATYSYTEADMGSRARFREVIKQAGTVFIVFWAKFQGMDNDAYLNDILEESLLETHNVRVWKHEAVGFYLVARRKDLGPVVCLPEMNCYWYTQHHSIPNGGFKRWIIRNVVFGFVVLGMALSVWFISRHRFATKET